MRIDANKEIKYKMELSHHEMLVVLLALEDHIKGPRFDINRYMTSKYLVSEIREKMCEVLKDEK